MIPLNKNVDKINMEKPYLTKITENNIFLI